MTPSTLPWSIARLLGHGLGFVLAVLLVGGCTGSSELAEGPPNVVLVMTDDQGYGDYGFTDNPVIQTPHLDSMAARSARVEQFYVSPVCSPTRASLMTGRYNYRTRVVDTWIGRSMMDPGEVTLAEMLREAGYATGIFGKWHLGDNYPLRPQEQGFEEVLVHRGGGIGQPSDPPEGAGRYTDPVLLHDGEKTRTDGYATDVYFDHALEWIEGRARENEPFFAYIPTNAPHAPFHDVPDSLRKVYEGMDLGNDQFPRDGYPLPADADQDRRARIYAMITNIDENVGRLFDGLERMGLTERTLVIFLGDNGPNGRRYVAGFRGSKASVYEGGVRTPFLMHWPDRLSPDRLVPGPAAHVDVVPTVLDALGIEPPAEVRLDGRSFWPQITGEAATWPDRPIVIQSHRGDAPARYHHAMIRSGEWKLVHPSGFGRTGFDGRPEFELYDLGTDPSETNDLSDRRPQLVDSLRAVYDRWFDDVGTTRPGNYGKPRIQIGTSHESPTVLTRQDWHPTNDGGWNSFEAMGYWSPTVARAGTYDVRVRHPEGFEGGRVTLVVDEVHAAPGVLEARSECPPSVDCRDAEYAATVDGSSAAHTFEAVPLRPGPVRLSVRLEVDGDAPGEGVRTGGAWQLVVERR